MTNCRIDDPIFTVIYSLKDMSASAIMNSSDRYYCQDQTSLAACYSTGFLEGVRIRTEEHDHLSVA